MTASPHGDHGLSPALREIPVEVRWRILDVMLTTVPSPQCARGGVYRFVSAAECGCTSCRSDLLSAIVAELERAGWCDLANDGSQEALEILCRVFDDGADVAYQEWLVWYDPTQWLDWSRALGAFIRMRLNGDVSI